MGWQPACCEATGLAREGAARFGWEKQQRRQEAEAVAECALLRHAAHMLAARWAPCLDCL